MMAERIRRAAPGRENYVQGDRTYDWGGKSWQVSVDAAGEGTYIYFQPDESDQEAKKNRGKGILRNKLDIARSAKMFKYLVQENRGPVDA